LNSFATVLYFNYLYFFMRDRFGFNDRQNLALPRMIGLIYTSPRGRPENSRSAAAISPRSKSAFGVMIAGLAVGSQLHSVPALIAAATVVNVGMCFIWPTLEALVSEGETPAAAARRRHLQHRLGGDECAGAFHRRHAHGKIRLPSIFFCPSRSCSCSSR
jgi:hypothetical protein